jgi:hypothetical protein
MGPLSVTIAGDLVLYLRRGVRQELAATLSILHIAVTEVNPTLYDNTLSRFDHARALLDTVGFADELDQPNLDIDLTRWPQLVLRTLELEYIAEVTRLQDAASDGYHLPLRNVPALGGLVNDIRKKVGATPKRKGTRSFLERQLALRRIRRWRGDS